MYMKKSSLKGFMFWGSWNDQCEVLGLQDRYEYMEALRQYAFYGKLPAEGDVSPVVFALMLGAIPVIDANLKNRGNGNKGGRPKKTNNPPLSKSETTGFEKSETTGFEKSETNINKNININKNLNKNENENENINGVCADAQCASAEPTPKKTSSNFNPPTEEDVKSYLLEKGLSEGDAMLKSERFVSFYASKGWMVGKNKMKNWRAAMSGWLARDKEESHAKMQESAGLSDTVLYLSKVM